MAKAKNAKNADLLNGQGIPQDYAQAVKWFHLAAEQGLAKAQFNLGLLYDTGHGIAQDYAQALKWYRLAAEQGVAIASNTRFTARASRAPTLFIPQASARLPEASTIRCAWSFIST